MIPAIVLVLLWLAWSAFVLSVGLHYGRKWTQEDLACLHGTPEGPVMVRAVEPAWSRAECPADLERVALTDRQEISFLQ